MTQVLPCRFQQRLGLFNMLTLQEYSETGLLRHLTKYDFASSNLGNTSAKKAHLFFQNVRNLI